VCAGRSEQIAEPGSFFLFEVAGESLIVVRHPSGAARALYNVCRHRGTRMCTQTEGRFKGAIQCPYHAWTYGLDGSLLVARMMEGTPGFDRAEYPLHAAAIAEFEGFLFVSLAPDEPFEQSFAPLFGRFDRWRLGRLRSAKRIAYEPACNWKLIFQNYSECYHCPVIHPQVEQLSAWDSGRNDLMEGPFLGGYMTLRDVRGSLTTTGHSSRPPLETLPEDDIGRVY